MIGFDQAVWASLLYAALLFAVAFLAQRLVSAGRASWLKSPIVYTLSLSIYCTGWTYYGAVGNAARSGMEYVTIYLGPCLVMLSWWWLLRKLVQVGKTMRVTSIADLISARFGKSNALGVMVTLAAIAALIPYIALQLQSIVRAFEVLMSADAEMELRPAVIGLWVAAGLASFALIFGTRNPTAAERQEGIIVAISLEAIVKLAALVAVGIFVIWGVAGGLAPMMTQIDASPIGIWDIEAARWITLTGLSAAAFLALPRMFQVMVVENHDERHLQMACWAVPLYLLLISIFVVPIAVTGLNILPEGANPDLFVLSIPFALEKDALTLLSFLGGFSSATSMVVVATLALATMVSNQLVMPVWLSMKGEGAGISGDLRRHLILTRSVAIIAITGLGYLYFLGSGGSNTLAAIGIVSFIGVAQFLPALLGGLFWRGATRIGALSGLVAGVLVWCWTAFLPSFGTDALIAQTVFDEGPLGVTWLRPYALFGVEGLDPTVHAAFWSLTINGFLFMGFSLVVQPGPLERLQGLRFVMSIAGPLAREYPASGGRSGYAAADDLMVLSQRILGPEETRRLFAVEAHEQDCDPQEIIVTLEFMDLLERELAAFLGAATAHALISQLTHGALVTVDDLMALADETAERLEYSNRLELKSEELVQTAEKLREANEKLKGLSQQKDSFLSKISHELRTPMTSIRAFSEILRDSGPLNPEEQSRYAGIISDQSIRLTRLLDDLLDLTVLEHGDVQLNIGEGMLFELIEHAIAAVQPDPGKGIKISAPKLEPPVRIRTDLDRLSQVFINLISNAQKYCDAPLPQLVISQRRVPGGLVVNFVDNGTSIPVAARATIFEQFSRSSETGRGAGLGLAICREVLSRIGGEIHYRSDGETQDASNVDQAVQNSGGNRFVVFLPDALIVSSNVTQTA